MDKKTPCQFCGVQPTFGHFDWCKRERAPTGKEVAEALILEYETSVDEGPSSRLAEMARSYLHHSATGDERG